MSEHRWKPQLLSFWSLQVIGWSLYAVAMYVTFLTVAAPGALVRLLWIKLFRAAFGFAFTSLLRLFYRKVVRQRSLTFIGWTAAISSVIGGALWTLAENGFWTWIGYRSSFWGAMDRLPRNTLDYGLTLLAWSALYFGIKYWQAWEAERERTLQAHALAQQAQLELLRYQLNPHFLFNALNSIRASIDEDKARAKRMVTEFSEFLRYSLTSSDAANISLREELAAIRNYLAIEQIRFEDKLAVQFEIEPTAEAVRIPGFLIHPLVENAIKHGMNGDAPLRLHIAARVNAGELHIEVANSGHWHANGNGMGIGLRNVEQRLQQLFPDRSHFTIAEADGWVRATIEIQA